MTKRADLIRYIGPALIVGVAYIDPGNVAANLAAGSQFGYSLTWVLMAASLSAWLFQYLSAKLGLVTGLSLPAQIGSRIKSKWLLAIFWIQALLVLIATDVAEILGGAIALNLLFKLPFIVGGICTAVISVFLVSIRNHFPNRFNLFIVLLLATAAGGFVYNALISPISWTSLAAGFMPAGMSSNALFLAASITGATIMPHALYSHSSLTRDAIDGELPRKSVLRFTKLDVTIALAIAGIGNLAIMVMSAANFSRGSETSIESAFSLIGSQLGNFAAITFGAALFASSLASSSLGNFASSEVNAGLLKRNINQYVRWLMSLIPALLLIALASNLTYTMVVSQIVLSFGLPFAVVPLIWFTSSKAIMGEFANKAGTKIIAWSLAAALILLNLLIL